MSTDRKIWQPLHPSIRPKLDPQYVAFHDAYIQYVQPDNTKPWDGSARTDPSLPPGGMDPVEVGSIKDVEVEGGDGRSNFMVRVYTPPEDDEPPSTWERNWKGWPALLWLHGGGWAIGGLDDRKDFCCWVCREAKCLVISVAYRLAPENPFPSALQDAITAISWLASSPSSIPKVDSSRISIGGTSAGGSLAIAAALAVVNPAIPLPSFTQSSSGFNTNPDASTSVSRGGVREPPRSNPHPPLSLLLIVPVIDNTATAETTWKPHADTAPWLTPSRMEWYRNMYFTGDSSLSLSPDQQRSNWDASPNLAPDELLAKLPRTWIAIAEQDLLAPEGKAFAEKLGRLDVDVEEYVVEGATHSIMSLGGTVDRGRKMIEDAAVFLKRVYGT